ncbi:DUF748 domain-containing protein [Thalassomonas actiniarum]|uniref:DUF748 domain-containing protein n=1 Tax=Thalassomonas actiniarum TaxID=485447 RepID=A0AAF0C5B0_9GAMM|nr:DUF748 domain-containing protein [Thalassomonas actiniarum]WDE00675.1 DUF748 domain-containing protein [Thalassomonas actiniarum]
MRVLAIKIAKIILLLFLTIYCLIWLLSPMISRYFIADILAPQKLVLSDNTSIRYNPFLSKLSINELSLYPAANREKALFRLDSLVVRIRLYQLLFDRIHINEFNLDGLFIDITQSENKLEVAGFTFPQTSDKPAENVEQGQEPTQDFPYTLVLPVLKLNNASLEFNLPQGQHEFAIDSLAISDVEATASRQDFSASLTSTLDQAPFALAVDASIAKQTDASHAETLIKISADIGLENFDLTRLAAFMPEEFSLHSGLLSYRTKLQLLAKKENQLQLDFKDMALDIAELHLEQAQTHATLLEKTLETKALSLQLALGDSEKPLTLLNGDAGVTLTDAKLYHQQEQAQLMAFESLTLDNILLTITDNKPEVKLDEVLLTGASFSDVTDNELPPIARVSSFAVQDIKASAVGVSINKVSLGNFDLDVSLDKDKQVENLVQLGNGQANQDVPWQGGQVGESAETSEETTASEHTASEQYFSLVLNEFALEQDSHIRFIDRSVTPAYKRDFIISTLSAGPVNNRQPEIKTAFALKGKSNEYAKFDLSGYAKPFLAEPVYAVSGGFKEISLPGISAYIKDALQYELQSGQLDLALELNLTGEEIDGHTDILLRGVELTSADDHQVDSLKDQTAIPFNVALGMLKDSDGNVELDIPLSGNISDPSFGFSGFLTLLTKQAVMSATREYLMTTFVPYANVVSITLSAGEYLLKVRFNDLLLSPGVSDFAQDNIAFLNEFSALMKDKPETQVTLCAVATAQDIGLPVGTEELTEVEIKSLNELSLKRLNHFKSYMVEQEQIDSSRLLLCSPQVDLSAEAQPRITFAT